MLHAAAAVAWSADIWPMKRLATLIVMTAGLLIGTRCGASAETNLPPASQVLDRYVEATGGRPALERLTNRVMEGRIEMTALGAGGDFKVWAKAPNKQSSQMQFEGLGSIREGFDGSVAWSSAPFQGVHVKEGEERARAQRSTVFPRELKLREIYTRIETTGSARIGKADAWVLEAYPEQGKPDRLYFDQQTGMLVREESTVKGILGEMIFQVDFSDYRTVDGVKVPFSMSMPKPAEVGFQIHIENVKHNVDIPDSIFAKPAR